jgi:hypothetical protein
MPHTYPTASCFPFMGSSSMNFAVNQDEDLLQFFNLYLDNKLVNIIVMEINKYTLQKQKGTSKER